MNRILYAILDYVIRELCDNAMISINEWVVLYQLELVATPSSKASTS